MSVSVMFTGFPKLRSSSTLGVSSAPIMAVKVS